MKKWKYWDIIIKYFFEFHFRTVTVYKSLQPLWAEEFKLHMPFGFQDVAVYVYDEDKVRLYKEEIFYLMMHSTHFIYGYMTSVKW